MHGGETENNVITFLAVKFISRYRYVVSFGCGLVSFVPFVSYGVTRITAYRIMSSEADSECTLIYAFKKGLCETVLKA